MLALHLRLPAWIAPVLCVAACGFPEYGGFGDGGGGVGASGGGTTTSNVTGTGGSGGGVTVECTASDDCASSAGGPVCDTDSGTCVECTEAEDVCEVGFYCTPANACDVGCNDDLDCGALTCDLVTHLCTGCTVDDECAPGSICDVPSTTCVAGCTPTHACATGDDCCAGLCEDLQTSVDNCGTCGVPCAPPNGTGACIGGQCTVDSCDNGLQDCDSDAVNGCESTAATDPDHCGSCPNACAALPNSTTACANGMCGLGACQPNFDNCDLMAPNGCEVNLLTSAANCAGCGNLCDLPNANNGCVGGGCVITSCDSGADDCDMNDANGCEIDTDGDPANCGGCDNVCTLANASAECVGGTCEVLACAPPNEDCNLNPIDGCEVNTNTTPTSCGMCGTICSLANATEGCSNGSCTIAMCDMGYADCDGNPANGCEINTNTSTGNCGGCTQACSNNNGTPTCTAGNCSIACAMGFKDCNMDVTDGCEINSTTNVNNCNTCGNVCPPAGGTPACVMSACTVSSCAAGQGDCDGNAGNGCETTTTTNVNHCGGCGLACFVANGTAGCAANNCYVASCNPGFDDCDGNPANGCEVNLRTTANCGSCGTTCSRPNGTVSCSTGTCMLTGCTGSFSNCDMDDSDGCEVNTDTSTGNCGACMNACSNVNGAPSCSGGSCSITCAAGYGNCDADVATGCEVFTTNNVNDCGACGNVCAVQNGTPACSGTNCVVSSCTAPFKNCDAQYSNGCEINSSTSLSNCGNCGTTCTNPNGTTSCVASVCNPVCSGTFRNCDGDPNDGCETDISSDNSSCGGCGMACSEPNANTQCTGGTCGIVSCFPGYADCDLDPTNGCEVALNTLMNCGACGVTCTAQNGTQSCTGSPGVCTPSCNAGFDSCDSNPNNGCEASLATLTNCNGCGLTCDRANAAETCPSGVCTLGMCNAGYGNCDGDPLNGCETDTNTTFAHCGACNDPCSTGQLCVAGNCTDACPAGQADCDLMPANGCEVILATNGEHCGTCPIDCTTSSYCGSSACTGCGAGVRDCDRLGTNACETNITNDESNCGTCGNTCTGSAPNASPSCTSSTCGLACNSGYSSCDATMANGCECGTAGCCGSSCQTIHDDGVGHNFYDCAPLCNANTNCTQAEALAACAAFTAVNGGTCAVFGLCGNGPSKQNTVWSPGASICTTWTYYDSGVSGNNYLGQTYQNAGSACTYCGAGFDTGLDWN